MKVPYSLRQAEIAVSTTGEGTGRTILANPEFNAAILVGECPSVPQMLELIEGFEQDLYASLKCLLKSRKGAVEDNQDDLDLNGQPFYFSGYWVKQDADSLTPRRYVFSVANTNALRVAAGFSGGGPRSPDYLSFPNEQFLKLGWDEQQALIDKALGSTFASMQAAIKPSADGVVLPDLKELLAQRGNVQVFLTEVLERATPENTTGELGCRTTQFLMWSFLAFLHRRGHLLLPISGYYLNLRSDQAQCYNELFFTLEQQEVFARLWQKTTPYKKENRFRIQSIAQATFLSTNVHSLGDINAEAFGIVSDELLNAISSSPSYRKKFKSHARKAYDLLVGFWNETSPERQIIGVADSRFLNTALSQAAIASTTTGRVRRRADPFWFADVPSNELYPRHPLPGYKPNAAVQAWATILRVAFPHLKIKDTSRYRNAGIHWLSFINDLPDPPHGFEDIIRGQHIHDLISRSPYTFRHRLAEMSLSPSGKNDVLSALSQMFGIYLRIHALDAKNPIEFDLDRFLAPQPRGKTPRTPLSPEMLLFLKEFNSREDFAFSRSLTPISRTTARTPFLRHYRRIIDTDDGEMKMTWWPGLAVLLDLMLTIPLRGFQARWLDTGEGDYLGLDLETLEESPNPLPTAQKGRQMGVFMSFAKGLDTSERLLGLRITTNKRAVECDGRYGIPWCPDNLRDTLSMLLAWQRKYNPIHEPVRAERDHWATHLRSEEVTALIPRIFPLFRDPASEDGAFPPTYMQVQTYWNLLCAAAEDELHVTRGATFRLTRDRARNVGGKNESVHITERVALFDLHTLRVSGITALIEAGLPPHFVQEIVGHAAIVMTLHYHKQHPGQVNSALSDAFASRELSLDRIPEVLKDLDSYEEFLINSRAAEDALGSDMLRSAIGNGTYQILSHGICPGGDCRTGGDYLHAQKEHQPVPRSGGCALCRYRVTGPMFLAGLVVNANKIMAELHSKGQEIARINDEVRARHREGKSAMAFESRREILHRELEDLWQEWAAEHQYVQDSSHMLVDYLRRCGESKTKLPVLARQDALEKLAVKAEHRHSFHLNQVLAEASAYLPADRHGHAIAERDAFLNELLANNALDPFLLRLDKNTKLAAGNMLGQILGDMVPDAELQPLHDGLAPIQGFIGLHESILKLGVQMQTTHMDGGHNELDPMRARALSEAIK